MRNYRQSLLFAAVFLMCLQWFAVSSSGAHLSPAATALLSGLCIFASSFVLSWASELAQFYVPQALALSFLALMAVVPEYAVDIYFAWTAGKNPQYISYACANMTGSNRLLIGLGWAVIIGAWWLKSKKNTITLDKSYSLDIGVLLAATLYSFIIPIKGKLSLIDTAVFMGIFVYYVAGMAKAHVKEPELENSAVEFIGRLPGAVRGMITLAFFAFAGYAIYLATKPFAESLLGVGAGFGIDKFLLVQWVAPLASEAPELIAAVIFVMKSQPDSSFRIMLSSKINQWTLLVGMLPLVYCISSGRTAAMVLDIRQVEELLLTGAQSFFALLVLRNLKFSLLEGAVLFVLFITQACLPSTGMRFAYSFLYLGLSLYIFIKVRKQA